MKKLIFLFSLLSSFSSFGQCVNLYVKKHIDGDPICRLSTGSILEICLDTKTINGGACTFYIQSSRMNGDVQTFEFGLDKTTMYFYAPKYGDLVINTNTKKFGFVIDNNSGAYSYYNEADMKKIREEENVERERQEKQLRDEENRKVDADKNEYLKIDNLVNEKKYMEAYLLVNKLYSPLNYPNATLIESALLDTDKTLHSSINESAKNSNYLQAFQSFDLLNFKDKYVFDLNDWSNIQEDLLITEYKKRKVKNLMLFVKKFLSDKYKEYTEEISNEDISQIIKNNQSTLSKLNSGSYELKITSAGDLLIDNKDSSKDYSYPKYMKIFHNEFEISVNGYSKLLISDSLEEFKNSGSTENLTMIEWKLNPKHEGSSIYYKKNKNKELKFYSDKSDGDFDYIGGKGEKLTYDSGISKKLIKYSVIENKVKYVNGIIVNEKPGLYTWTDKELIIKRHIARNVAYASLLGGLTWWYVKQI